MAPRGKRRRSGPLAIRWADRALADLERIADLIGRDDLEAATRWVEKLESAAERAARMPHAGRRLPELDRDDVREVLVGAYRLVYQVGDDSVRVLTVFEGHRQMPRDAGDREA